MGKGRVAEGKGRRSCVPDISANKMQHLSWKIAVMSARETPQEGCVSAKLFNYCKFLHSALLHALLWVPVQECRGISEAMERGGVSRRASGMNGGLTHFQLLLLTAFSGWLTLFCAFTWAFIASSSLPLSLFPLTPLSHCSFLQISISACRP